MKIGFLNLFRGGDRVHIGRYATILRLNVMNSRPSTEAVNPTVPELQLGEGAVVTNGHWLDFTDRIELGDHAIIGGRNSSLWTHNRQRTRPITHWSPLLFGLGNSNGAGRVGGKLQYRFDRLGSDPAF